jgi:hypothetical protein
MQRISGEMPRLNLAADVGHKSVAIQASRFKLKVLHVLTAGRLRLQHVFFKISFPVLLHFVVAVAMRPPTFIG